MPDGLNEPEFPDSWGTRLSLSEIDIYVPGNSEKEL